MPKRTCNADELDLLHKPQKKQKTTNDQKILQPHMFQKYN